MCRAEFHVDLRLVLMDDERSVDFACFVRRRTSTRIDHEDSVEILSRDPIQTEEHGKNRIEHPDDTNEAEGEKETRFIQMNSD